MGTSHLGKHATEVSFFSIGESVVHQISTLNGSQWDGARNANHRNVFAVCTGDTVDRAKSSDTVRHDQRADAVDSCISIGRVRCVELVAISNPGRCAPFLQLLHKFEVVVARHTKDMPNTSFFQPA